jgi:hypothetical protein
LIYDLIVPTGGPIGWLGVFWFIMFFTNLFVVSFDVSSTKFFVLILIVVVGILLVIFLVLPNIALPTPTPGDGLNPGLITGFYLVMTLIFLLILGLVFIGARINYYKLERNEIYHKSGVFSAAQRYPVKSLRIKKEITDVFEFFVLRAGSITLMPGKADEVIHLPTVLNINRREKEIDYLLSHIGVEPDELDA